ncbi:hypothetical protein, partial [Pseudomonas sp. P5_A2_2]
MSKVIAENGVSKPEVAKGVTPISGVTGDKFHIEFFNDGRLEGQDKLALLNFLMREFALQQPVVLKGTGSAIEAQFLQEQYSRQQKKVDLLYLDAD